LLREGVGAVEGLLRELQKPPEMALVGVMPATLNAAFWITFPSWM
jgi:hypothetical protein